MICSYCATELPRGAMFCGECGRPVVAAEAPVREEAQDARDTPAPTEVEDLVEVVMPERGEEVLSRLASDLAIDEESVDEPEIHDLPAENEADQPAEESLDEPADEPADEAADEAADEEAEEPANEAADRAEQSEPERCVQCRAVLATDDIFCGDCGFVRQGGAARPRDTVSLDPFPWGAPTGPGPSALREEPVPTFDDDIDETRIVDRSARGDRFVLQFSTGDSVSVTGTGLLGRNPVAEPGEYFDTFVTISDPGKSVSKTHLEFGQDGGAFWISDRYSGNGTVVRQPETPARRCEAGKRYRIVRGTRVDIGEQFFIVS